MMAEMQYTDEELLALDPQLKAIFEQRGVPKLVVPTVKNIHHVRKGFAMATARFNTSTFAKSALQQAYLKSSLTEHDEDIAVRNGRTIQGRIYTPSVQRPQGFPVLVFMHAGGWFAGDLETEAFLCRLFCATFGLLVVNVEYGLHPDVSFGVPQADCLDACSWVVDNAKSLNADLSAGFIIGGNSGGCTWASVAAHLWQELPGRPPITGCFFLAPIFSNEHETEDGDIVTKYDFATQYRSWWQCKDAPLMNDEMRNSIANLTEFDFKSRLLSPFMFASHSGTGATYIAACGVDPWRDGGVLYAEELQKAKMPVKLDLYPGQLHCWWTTFPQLEATKTWLEKTLAGMEWVLRTGTSLPSSPKL